MMALDGHFSPRKIDRPWISNSAERALALGDMNPLPNRPWSAVTRLEELLPDGSHGDIRGLRHDEIDVVFQPIVEVATGSLFAVEGLVRCSRDEFHSPLSLFEAAVAQEACGRLGRMIRDISFSRVPDLPMFVNVHPREISSRWLVRPDDPLFFHEKPVYLEVTESAAFDYFDLCDTVLREVCERSGAKLVVDDFGAGHSSLSRIVQLEPAVVKLDRSLVAGLHLDRRRQILLKHVTRLCNELGARVVAEGIETMDELSAVIDSGADLVQGFYIARPDYPLPLIHWPL